VGQTSRKQQKQGYVRVSGPNKFYSGFRAVCFFLFFGWNGFITKARQDLSRFVFFEDILTLTLQTIGKNSGSLWFSLGILYIFCFKQITKHQLDGLYYKERL